MARLGRKQEQEIVLPEWEEVEIEIATPTEAPVAEPVESPELVPAKESRHASYVRMLRRMVAAGINDSTVSPSILADAETEYTRRFGKVVA